MYDYQEEYNAKKMTPAQAVSLVRSGDRVFIGLVSSIAYCLADALWERRNELEDIEISCSQSLKPTPLFMTPGDSPFTVVTPFIGPGERMAQKNGRPLVFSSIHLSQVDIWAKEIANPTVAFFQVSEPDENDYMSMGPGGSSINAFVLEKADRIIVQVNKNTPYLTGEKCLIHISEVDAIVEQDEELPSLPEDRIDPVTQEISNNILKLVPDGATIQLGIGKLSTAIGYGLKNHNDLGIHSELFCTPMMDLIKNGNVTNRCKGYMDGLSVYAFAMGSKEMYEFMDHKKDLYAGLFTSVNDPRNIARCNRMISINSAMAIDIFGQVAADSMGWYQQSAVGGQIDFVKGAQWSNEGKSIIATSSSFMKNGIRQSKIVLNFPTGTAVTTPRSEVQYVATEYGCINLKPLRMPDRIRAVISLAHPDFRDGLTDEAKRLGLIS